MEENAEEMIEMNETTETVIKIEEIEREGETEIDSVNVIMTEILVIVIGVQDTVKEIVRGIIVMIEDTKTQDSRKENGIIIQLNGLFIIPPFFLEKKKYYLTSFFFEKKGKEMIMDEILEEEIVILKEKITLNNFIQIKNLEGLIFFFLKFLFLKSIPYLKIKRWEPSYPSEPTSFRPYRPPRPTYKNYILFLFLK